MKGVTILLGLAATLASSHALSNGLRGSNNAMRVGVAPVPELNVEQYLGRWYQMYTDVSQNVTIFKGDSYCVTADYGLFPNGTVSVQNSARLKSPTGALDQILGWAAVTDPSNPGALTVHLQGVPFGAPYVVGLLGPPVGPKNLYDFAVVSDPLNLSLFVLARDPDTFRAKYNTAVLTYLKEQGFTNALNRPTPTMQGSQCEYVPIPPQSE